MRALIDGDILVYRCGFAAESTRYTLIGKESGIPHGQFDSSVEMKAYIAEQRLHEEAYDVEKERLYEPLSHALANIKSVMSTILEKVPCDEAHVILSQGRCFRNGIATILDYKANRKDAPKPIYYDDIRGYLITNYGARVYNSVEADDVLALCQDDSSVIVSIDKDLLQVPGKHYNWVKDERSLITPEVGLRKLYQQVLSGDSTDNIPGIRGVGPATARKLLAAIAPTKSALSAECTAQWDRYLRSELEKPIPFTLVEENVHEPLWRYTGWDGHEYVRPVEEIAMEVFQLVQVGGIHAKDALRESGEELPFAAATKGQEAIAA